MLRKIGGRWIDPTQVVAVLPPGKMQTPQGPIDLLGKCVAFMPSLPMPVPLDCGADEAGKEITAALLEAHAQNIELARASAKGGA